MSPSQFFHHCPRCGAKQASLPPANVLRCPGCGFHLYFNPTVSVSAFIERDDGRALFIQRAKEPAKGRLAPPGGFVDFDETAEVALRREVREEVGLELADIRFLCTATNRYVYREVTYPVLDLYFVARAVDPERAAALDGVESVRWLGPLEARAEDMAFLPTMVALQAYQATRRTPA
jgi:ADP-ribose pyrophosphatase YjhB (NUDIX family)